MDETIAPPVASEDEFEKRMMALSGGIVPGVLGKPAAQQLKTSAPSSSPADEFDQKMSAISAALGESTASTGDGPTFYEQMAAKGPHAMDEADWAQLQSEKDPHRIAEMDKHLNWALSGDQVKILAQHHRKKDPQIEEALKEKEPGFWLGTAWPVVKDAAVGAAKYGWQIAKPAVESFGAGLAEQNYTPEQQQADFKGQEEVMRAGGAAWYDTGEGIQEHLSKFAKAGYTWWDRAMEKAGAMTPAEADDRFEKRHAITAWDALNKAKNPSEYARFVEARRPLITGSVESVLDTGTEESKTPVEQVAKTLSAATSPAGYAQFAKASVPLTARVAQAIVGELTPSVDDIVASQGVSRDEALAIKKEQDANVVQSAISDMVNDLNKNAQVDPALKSFTGLVLPGGNVFSVLEIGAAGALKFANAAENAAIRVSLGMTKAEQQAVEAFSIGQKARIAAEDATKMGPIGKGATRVADMIDVGGQRLEKALGNIPDPYKGLLSEGIKAGGRAGVLGGIGAAYGEITDPENRWDAAKKGAMLGLGLSAPRLISDLAKGEAALTGRMFQGAALNAESSEFTKSLLRGGEKIKLSPNWPKTLDAMAGFAKAGVATGVRMVPLTLAAGLMEDQTWEELQKSYASGMVYGLGGGWLGRAMGKDATHAAEMRRQMDFDYQKEVKKHSPETQVRMDMLRSYDNEIERRKNNLSWAESNLQNTVQEVGLDNEFYDEAVKNVKNAKKYYEQAQKASPEERVEYSRHMGEIFTDAAKVANGVVRGGRNLNIELLTEAEIENRIMQRGASQGVTPEFARMAARQRGAYFGTDGVVNLPNGNPVKLFDRDTVVVNLDKLKRKQEYSGRSFAHVFQHEMGHALEGFEQYRELNRKPREILFGRKIELNGETVHEEPGIYSENDLADMYLDTYTKGKSKNQSEAFLKENGLWSWIDNKPNRKEMAETQKEEIIADLNARGLSGGIRYFANSPVQSVVDWVTASHQNNVLAQSLRNIAGLGGESPFTSEYTKATFSPEVLELNKRALQAARDLNGNFTGVRGPLKPKISRQDILQNEKLREHYMTGTPMFKEGFLATVYDAAGNPVYTSVVQSPGAKEGEWKHVDNGDGTSAITRSRGFGNIPSEVGPDVVIPVGGGVKVERKIILDENGKPAENDRKARKILSKARGRMVREALDGTPDVGAPNRMRAVLDDGLTYRGTLTPLQRQAIENLPEGIVPLSIKEKLFALSDMISKDDGTQFIADYANRMDVNGNYRSFSPKLIKFVPIGLHFSKDDNLLVTTISVDGIEDKLDLWKKYMPERLSPWNYDTDKFMEQFHLYLKNWEAGLEDKTDHSNLDSDPQKAEIKKSIFNDLLNMYDKETQDKNPDRTKLNLDKSRLTPEEKADGLSSDPNTVVRSRRLDSIASLEVHNGQKIRIPYQYAKNNWMAEGAPEVSAGAEEKPVGPIGIGLGAVGGQKDFYSKAGEVLLSKMPERASYEQLRNMLDPARGSGVKRDELKWSGILPYMERVAQEKGQVSKADIQKFLKEGYGARFTEETMRQSQYGEDQTRYSQWKLPGGSNYQETVLQMPGVDYTSSHFGNVPNYVAHMRTQDFGNGRLIEELQSDSHQAARKRGYKNEQLRDYNRVREIEAKGQAATPEERKEWTALMNAGAMRQDGVADAPFRKDWPLQLFKHALQKAVADGKEWVGWTGGEAQAERYDLSKQVSSIEYLPKTQVLRAFNLDGQEAFEEVVPKEKIADYVGKDAAERLLATEPYTAGSGKQVHALRGVDLKLGGEGMRGFYDTILPNEIGKYVKQWGANVEPSEIKARSDHYAVEEGNQIWNVVNDNGAVLATYNSTTPERAKELAQNWLEYNLSRYPNATLQSAIQKDNISKIWKVAITPEMREGVKRGQPLFMAENSANADTHQAELDAFSDKWKKSGVRTSPYIAHGTGDIRPGMVIVPKEKRSQGIGTQVMEDLVRIADQQGRRIALTPSTDFGGTSVSRLKDFYSRFGFVENKGKNKDFATKETMLRPAAKEAIKSPTQDNRNSSEMRFMSELEGQFKPVPTQEELDAMKAELPKYASTLVKIGAYSSSSRRIAIYDVYQGHKDVIGYAYVRPKPENDALEIESTHIDGEWRGKGYGQALYREIAKFAQEQGISKLTATSTSRMAAEARSRILETKWKGAGWDAESRVPASVRFMSEEHAAAHEAGDEEKARNLVRQAAEKAGYSRNGKHGTTHSFTVFNTSRANVENDMGKGFYFSTSPKDVEANYAGVGPDLTSRIEKLTETLYDSMEEKEVDQYGSTDAAYAAAKKQAEQELAGNSQRVIDAFINLKNPLILGGKGETTFEENQDLYSKYPAGQMGQLIGSIEGEGQHYNDIYGARGAISKIAEQAYNGEITAREVINIIKDQFSDATDPDTGDIATNQIVRQVIEDLGFDGIVDNTVNERFGKRRKYGQAMAGIDENTQHIIAFNPESIKSADPFTYDDQGKLIPLSERFNPRKNDIRFMAEPNRGININDSDMSKYGFPLSNIEALTEPKLIPKSGRVASDLSSIRFMAEDIAGNGQPVSMLTESALKALDEIGDKKSTQAGADLELSPVTFTPKTITDERGMFSIVIGAKPGEHGYSFRTASELRDTLETISGQKAAVETWGELQLKKQRQLELIAKADESAKNAKKPEKAAEFEAKKAAYAEKVALLDTQIEEMRSQFPEKMQNMSPEDAAWKAQVKKLNRSFEEVSLKATPAPFTANPLGIRSLAELGDAVHDILKSDGFNRILKDFFDLDGLEIRPIAGTWQGKVEPSFDLVHPNLTFDKAKQITQLLTLAFAQDAGITYKPSIDLKEGTQAVYLIHSEKLTDDQLKLVFDKAREVGVDVSTTTDGKGIKALNFGTENFFDKVKEIQTAASINQFHETLVDSELYETEKIFKGRDSQRVLPSWWNATSGGQSLLQRSIDSLLIDYAKAAAAQGYIFDPALYAKRYGLSDTDAKHIRDKLYPVDPMARSASPLLAGTEILPVRSTYTLAGKRETAVPDMIHALQNRAASDGVILPGDYSPRAMDIISSVVADEVQQHMARAALNPKSPNAIGWYDAALKRMKGMYSQLFPWLEVGSPQHDADKSLVFDAVLGIASQGNDVFENGKMATRVTLMLENGKTLPEIVTALHGTFGDKTAAIENNILKLHELLTRHTPSQLRALLFKTDTVANWNKNLKQDTSLYYNGEPLSVEGGKNQMVTGFMVFGPKIGSFINNLHGDYSTLTADLWYTRTWNRILGRSFKYDPLKEGHQFERFQDSLIEEYNRNQALKKGKEYTDRVLIKKGVEEPYLYGEDAPRWSKKEFHKLLEDSGAMLEFAEHLEKVFRTGSFKGKTELRRAAKNWVQDRTTPLGAPRASNERAFQQTTMEQAQARLAQAGIVVTIADMQAALWFNEKELFGKYGAATSGAEPADYADAAKFSLDIIQAGGLFQVDRKGETVRLLSEADEANLTGVKSPNKGLMKQLMEKEKAIKAAEKLRKEAEGEDEE